MLHNWKGEFACFRIAMFPLTRCTIADIPALGAPRAREPYSRGKIFVQAAGKEEGHKIITVEKRLDDGYILLIEKGGGSRNG
jgi:hypothetical protein